MSPLVTAASCWSRMFPNGGTPNVGGGSDKSASVWTVLGCRLSGDVVDAYVSSAIFSGEWPVNDLIVLCENDESADVSGDTHLLSLLRSSRRYCASPGKSVSPNLSCGVEMEVSWDGIAWSSWVGVARCSRPMILRSFPSGAYPTVASRTLFSMGFGATLLTSLRSDVWRMTSRTCEVLLNACGFLVILLRQKTKVFCATARSRRMLESMLRYVDARLEELDTSCGSKNLCGIHGKNSL